MLKMQPQNFKSETTLAISIESAETSIPRAAADLLVGRARWQNLTFPLMEICGLPFPGLPNWPTSFSDLQPSKTRSKFQSKQPGHLGSRLVTISPTDPWKIIPIATRLDKTSKTTGGNWHTLPPRRPGFPSFKQWFTPCTHKNSRMSLEKVPFYRGRIGISTIISEGLCYVFGGDTALSVDISINLIPRGAVDAVYLCNSSSWVFITILTSQNTRVTKRYLYHRGHEKLVVSQDPPTKYPP